MASCQKACNLAQKNLDDQQAKLAEQKTDPTLALEIVGLSDFIGTDSAQFTIKNGGIALVNSNDIQVKLTNIQGIAFSLGSKTGSTIECSLTELLGGTAVDIGPNKTTGDIILKLGAATPETISNITLQLFNKGEAIAIATKHVTWTAKIKLSLTVTSPVALKGRANNQIVLQVTNNGQEDIALGQLKLKIIRSEGIQAQLTGATGKDYKLDLPKLDKGSKLDKTLTIDPKTDTKAEFKFQLEYDGKPIGSENKVTWQEDTDLELTLKKDSAKKKITYTVVNKGSEGTAQEVKLWYKNSDAVNKAMLEGKKEAQLPLGKIGPGATVTADLAVDLDSEPQADFEFEVRYAGAFQAKKITIQGDKAVVLVFYDETELKLKGRTNNQIKFRIENNKGKSEKNKLKLQATRTKGKAAVIPRAKKVGEGIYEVELFGIELNPGDWSQEQTLEIDPGKDVEAAFSLQLIYDGDEVGNTKQVSWQEDVQLVLQQLNYFKDASGGVIIYQVSKIGTDIPNQKLVLKYKNTDPTNKATLWNPNGSNAEEKKDKTESEITLVIEKPHKNPAGTGAFSLNVKLNSESSAQFEFKVFYGDTCIGTKTLDIK
jgi:hypothetical protein